MTNQTITVLQGALAALDIGKHEGCGCSECGPAVRRRGDARAEVIAEIARLQAEAAHAELVALGDRRKAEALSFEAPDRTEES